jgi:hypothetical protein
LKGKAAHEPEAKVMNAEDVWDDAQQIADVLRQNLLKGDPMVKLQIPLSIFLAAVDNFSQDELILLRRRIDERLAA